MKTTAIITLLIAMMAKKCEDTSPNTDIIEIRYGTSFGMCMGFCQQEVRFTNDGLVQKKLTPRPNQELKEKTCEKPYSGFQALASKIDFDTFYSLDETIGCPDCADGGAEWIEIITVERTKKVTFELQHEPLKVQSFIADLRRSYKELGACDQEP